MPFSSRDAERIDAVLDALIPPRQDADLPGAGALGVGESVRAKIEDAAPLFVTGLDWLDGEASARGAADFAALSLAARCELLDALEREHPGLLPALLFHTYAGYYELPRVVEALGVPGRPPHPEGYPLEEGDLTKLDRVRARTGLYREV